MKKINEYHIPVLLKETINALKIKPGGKYIDATLGGGGHSEEIIRAGGELLALDVDPEAVKYAEERLGKVFMETQQLGITQNPPKIVQENFSKIDEVARENNFLHVDGILFDLGVSSHQLQVADRGFSFNQEGFLDMRMDPRLTVTAKDLVNGLNEGELSELFLKLGEEKHHRRYADEVCRARKTKKIETCDMLAGIILRAAPHRSKLDRTHPATRVFQALRIAVNDELNSLRTALPKTVDLLREKGRLAVLSFHSLEDGIVKRFFLEMEKEHIFEIITPKPIVSKKEEIDINPRARSAKLRVVEKL